MGTFCSAEDMRKFYEKNTEFRGYQIRIEKVTIVPKEGKNDLGCPIAKQVLVNSDVQFFFAGVIFINSSLKLVSNKGSFKLAIQDCQIPVHAYFILLYFN